MSIEGFLAFNMVMTVLLSCAAAHGICHMRPVRLLLAALAGGVCSLAALIPAARCIGAMPFRLLPALLCARILTGGRAFLPLFLRMLALTFTLGGAIFLTGGSTLPRVGQLAIGGVLCLITFFLPASAKPETGEALLRLETEKGSLQLRAFVDTGNRLREPLSGLPVLIVEEELLAPLLDVKEANGLPRGYRLVRYAALGGGGQMRCFRPTGLYVLRRGAWQETADAYVAVYPGRMSGNLQALAPPTIL